MEHDNLLDCITLCYYDDGFPNIGYYEDGFPNISEIFDLLDVYKSKHPMYNKSLGYESIIQCVKQSDFECYLESGSYEDDVHFDLHLKEIEENQMENTDWTPVADIDHHIDLPLWKTTSDRISDLLSNKGSSK